MNTARPVNLALTTIRFPIPAIISILHRIAGIFLFISLPFWLWALHHALGAEQDYALVLRCVTSTSGKIFTLLSFAALIYHFAAGVRHILMDFGFGETLRGGRIGAYSVLGISAIMILITGAWLW